MKPLSLYDTCIGETELLPTQLCVTNGNKVEEIVCRSREKE